MLNLFAIDRLRSEHNKASFNCGVEQLDNYIHRQASQDIRRKVSTCFVALDNDKQVVGYYTLASSGIPLRDLPKETQRKLPKYPLIPVVRMGRLAVDLAVKNKGLGSALLVDALERVVASDIAAFALIVDAKDLNAATFYLHHGFIGLADNPLCLFLPLATATELIASTN